MAPQDKQNQDLEALRDRFRDPERWAALHEAVADRQREPGWLVILGVQPETPSPDDLKAVADAMEWDVFTARQRLLAPTPRIIRRMENQRDAEDLADWMRRHGLRSFAISEQVLATQNHVMAVAVYESRGELTFDDKSGARHTRAVGDVVCLVAGEIVERTISESAQKGMLAGEEVNAQRENLRLRAEYVIDVHFRNSPDSMRLCQDSIQYGNLFPNADSGSAVLVRQLFERLIKTLPGKPVYNEFRRVQEMLGTSRHLVSTSQYLIRNWTRPGSPIRIGTHTTTQESNVDAFMIYSTLARLESIRG